MDRSLPGFASIKQFAEGVPNGFCGGAAILAALHNHIDDRYQLTPDGLEALYQYLVGRQLCDANGAMNIGHVFQAVRELYPAGLRDVELVSYGPGSDQAAFHQVLQANAGVRAIIVEYANGQALAGDEPGLHFHFECVGAISTEAHLPDAPFGGYGVCDGDSSENHQDGSATPPLWRPIQMLFRAQPIAYVICAE